MAYSKVPRSKVKQKEFMKLTFNFKFEIVDIMRSSPSFEKDKQMCKVEFRILMVGLFHFFYFDKAIGEKIHRYYKF